MIKIALVIQESFHERIAYYKLRFVNYFAEMLLRGIKPSPAEVSVSDCV